MQPNQAPSSRQPRSEHSPRTRRSLAALALVLGTAACQQKPSDTAQPAAVAAPLTSSTASSAGGATGSAAASARGLVRVLSADAEKLQRPTTAAFRGSTLWIAIGQLSALFEAGKQPQLPFGAVSLDLERAAFGAEPIALPGPDYYPEGITAAADGTLYIGSIMQRVISKVAPDSNQAQPFLAPGVARRGVIGLTVDAGRQLLWFCDSGPKLEEAKKAGDLVGVRLTDGQEVVRHALPAHDGKAPFCNDVIVGGDGTLWSTESAAGRVFRVPADKALTPGSATAWLVGGEIGPPASGGSGANGLEMLGRFLIVANVGRGTLVALDPESTAPDRGARTLVLSDAQTQAPVSLCSPDGLERLPGSADTLVVVENGGCATKTPRISQVSLTL